MPELRTTRIKDRNTSEGGQLAAGVRASAGTVGYLGSEAALTVLNPGDSLTGTVFEGTGTSWSGDLLRVSGSDLVIDHYRINASVAHVSGANLTITNCIIQAPQGANYHVVNNDGPAQASLTIEDTTLIGTPGPGTTTYNTGVQHEGRLTMRRCDISGVGDAVHIAAQPGGWASGSLMSQVYMHDLTFLDPAQHADFIQCWNNDSAWTSGQTYLTVEHCATDLTVGPVDATFPNGQAYSSGITIGTNVGAGGATMSAKVDNCYFPKGTYHLRLNYQITDCIVTNNAFGFYYPAEGEFALADVNTTTGLTWSGNIDGNGNSYTYGSPGPSA